MRKSYRIIAGYDLVCFFGKPVVPPPENIEEEQDAS